MPAATAATAAGVADFSFRKKRDRLDWRVLASVDAQHIARTVDVQALQSVIDMVTYCDIEAEDVRHLDSNYVKLYQLAQMIIEYLLYCQTMLRENEAALVAQLDHTRHELDSAKDLMEKHLAQMFEVKKENRFLKKTVYAYQMVSKLPGFAAGPATVGGAVTYHHCSKAFNARHYLDAHMQRRHPEAIDDGSYHTADDTSKGMFVPYQEDNTTKKDVAALEKISATIEQFSHRIVDTERQIRTEMEEKLQTELQRRREESEALQRAERLRYEQDMRQLRGELQRELEDERRRLDEERHRLEELAQQAARTKSNLGQIESADESDLNPDPSPPPPKHNPVEEILSRLEERQEKTLSTIRDVVKKEIDDMKHNLDLKEQERASKLNEDRNQISAMLQSATQRFETLQQSASPAAQPSPAAKAPFDESSDDSNNAEHTAPTVDQNAGTLPQISDSEESTHGPHEDDWDRVSKGLRQHNEVSLPQAPWVKSLFAHAPDQIATMRTQLRRAVDSELSRIGVTAQVVRDKKLVEKKRRDIERDRKARHKEDAALAPAFQHMFDHMEKTVQTHFKAKLKPVLTVHTNSSGSTLGQRPPRSALKSPSSPVKGPSKVGFSRLPRWQSNMRARNVSPRKSMYDRDPAGGDDNSDEEVDWNDDATSYVGSTVAGSDSDDSSYGGSPDSEAPPESANRRAFGSPDKFRASTGSFAARSRPVSPKTSTPLTATRSPRFSASNDGSRRLSTSSASRKPSPFKRALTKTKSFFGKKPSGKQQEGEKDDSDDTDDDKRRSPRKSRKFGFKRADDSEADDRRSSRQRSVSRDPNPPGNKKAPPKTPGRAAPAPGRDEDTADAFDWDISDSSGENEKPSVRKPTQGSRNADNSFDEDSYAAPTSMPQIRSVQVGYADEEPAAPKHIDVRAPPKAVTGKQDLSDIDAVLQDLNLEDL
ncbi:hypothetical protein RI367_008124 [Sorochytrium milnesiophthora]